MAETLLKDAAKIVFLCMLWYLFSSAANIASKTVISEFPYPQTVSMAHLVVTVCVMSPAVSLLNIEAAPLLSTKQYLLTIVPLALGKVATSVFSHIGILSVPVSYAHTVTGDSVVTLYRAPSLFTSCVSSSSISAQWTSLSDIIHPLNVIWYPVKALMPLFTVGLSLFILKEKHSWKVYLSLVPIVLGVLIATVTEIQFDLIGLVASLASTLFNALQNIYSKKVLKEVSIHYLRLLLLQSQAAVLLLAPIWIFTDVWSIASHKIATLNVPHVLLMLALAGLFALGQSVFAFSVLSLMSPTSYSVANATKRIVIITTSLLLLKNPVTVANVGGMGLAVCGVLLYNKAKLDSRQAPSILPIHHDDKSKPHPSPSPDDDGPGSISRRILQNAARSSDILTFI